MALPASEDTRNLKVTYVQNEMVDHLIVPNGSGADWSQGDFVIVGPFGGVADKDVADGAIGSIHVEEGIQLHANDLKATEDTFATWGQAVYWDDTTKEFSDTSTAGYYAVGYLTQVKDADGMIIFEKTRYATEIV